MTDSPLSPTPSPAPSSIPPRAREPISFLVFILTILLAVSGTLNVVFFLTFMIMACHHHHEGGEYGHHPKSAYCPMMEERHGMGRHPMRPFAEGRTGWSERHDEMAPDEQSEGEVLAVRTFLAPPSMFQDSTTQLTSGGATTGTLSKDVTASLKNQGVQFPQGATATYLPNSSKLVIRDTPDMLDLVASLIDQNSKPDMIADMHLKKLTEMLALTDSQQAEIQPFLKSRADLVQKLHNIMKQFDSDTQTKISAILTPDQQKKLDSMPVPPPFQSPATNAAPAIDANKK